ncbi:hypothetical protein CN553_12650 [Bacillus cereus]|uniref:Uncharacterized protein n=1 Tax=Bacillus cereus TaxID=1396 RepID=A0A9X6UC72_BACCE|nr:hypothetical protein [Bacillus cereus]EOO44233.1 hypothetical protein ICK_06490 [Bacillus cereus BAG1X2-2]EOP00368.1 hypothetical protein ICO_06324 [Bacillus cereus BAG2O-1]PEN97880.1 hypothetical protein CN553_12650 [Bacillus cereus]
MNKQLLIQIRNEFFKEMGSSRLKRVLFCTFFIANIWCFADLLSGSLSINLWHDLICLVLGIVSERLIPWGK